MGLLTKRAGVGDDFKKPFERSMAQLGWNHIKEQAPQLLDHVVGFQLVERADDENERAVGAFGFKVGNLELAIPVIYNNGEVDGYQTLWVKNSDIVVPAKDKWVNYLISKQARDLGDPVPGTRTQLRPSSPDLRTLSYPSLTKYSSVHGGWDPVPCSYDPNDLADWAVPFATAWKEGKVLTKAATQKTTMTERLCGAHEEFFKYACDLYRHYPSYRMLLEKLGGADLLRRAGERLLEARPHVQGAPILDLFGKVAGYLPPMATPTGILPLFPQAAPPTPAFPKEAVMHVFEDMSLADNEAASRWKEEDKKKLLEDGYVIRDSRDDKQKKVLVETTVETQSPTETGIYEIVDHQGDFVRCFVGFGGTTDKGECRSAIVWPIDKSTRPILSDPKKLIAKSQPGSQVELEDFIKGLPDAKSAKGDAYMVFVTTGDKPTVSGMFRPYHTHKNGVSFRGHFADMPIQGRALEWNQASKSLFSHTIREGFSSLGSGWNTAPPDYNVRILETDTPTASRQISVKDGVVFIPASAKVLITDDSSPASGPMDRPDNAFVPGDYDDMRRKSLEKTASFAIWNNGEIHVKTAAWQRVLTPRDAHFWLVKGAGLSLDDAQKVLERMRSTRGQIERWHVKAADQPMPMADRGHTAPAFPDPLQYQEDNPFGSSYMVQPSQLQEIPQPEYGAGETDPSMYDMTQPPTAPSMQGMQLGQSGMADSDEDRLDTASMLSLVRGINKDNLTSGTGRGLLPSLMGTMDEVGKTLIKINYKPDAFEERYGAEDMPELKSGLQNLFDQLGDTSIFLAEKRVDPFGIDDRDLNLGRVAG
jgi:hypothetical protein